MVFPKGLRMQTGRPPRDLWPGVQSQAGRLPRLAAGRWTRPPSQGHRCQVRSYPVNQWCTRRTSGVRLDHRSASAVAKARTASAAARRSRPSPGPTKTGSASSRPSSCLKGSSDTAAQNQNDDLGQPLAVRLRTPVSQRRRSESPCAQGANRNPHRLRTTRRVLHPWSAPPQGGEPGSCLRRCTAECRARSLAGRSRNHQRDQVTHRLLVRATTGSESTLRRGGPCKRAAPSP